MFRGVRASAGEMHERTCPVCDSLSARRVFDKDSYTYVACGACGLVYINPVPSDDVLANEYDEVSADYFLDERRLAIDEYPERHAREVQLLRRVGASGRLLDVGCATGSFMMAAKSIGFVHIAGIDIAKPSIAVARRRGFDAVAGSFPTGFFPRESADVITMWNTLEHLAAPFEFVREAERVLRPGGFLATSVPNYDSLSVLLLGTRYRYIELAHLNYFNRRTLGRLLQRAGFDISYMETRSFNPYVVWQDLRGSRTDTEEMIRETQLSRSFKTKTGFAPARFAYSIVDRLLQITGHGDSLLMAARKSK
jgi:2-polyprenyl-3-methyl-5-hydroxy-6-metoxy-1,4-benzoquinol methylase